jgi:threonine/homoserine/homoserine lactone efflux protein
MSWQIWWLFVCGVFVICATPGPNMLHVMSRSQKFGYRRSMAAMAGCLSAILLALTASVAGLAALLIASPLIFEVLRYVGVAYLVYLGIAAWRGAGSPLDMPVDGQPPSQSAWQLFRGGFLVSISNPKMLLFAAAFFPQFIDRTQPQAPQFAILVATFCVLELFWYGVYALGGRTLAGYLSRPAWQRGFDRATGVVFVGFGLALLKFRPG